MSKWFNARSRGVCALLFAIAALSGCSREDEATETQKVRATTVVEPEIMGIDTVAEEEPAVARAQWRAANDTSRTIAGNLRVSLEGVRGGPVVFAFANGVTIRAQPIDVVPADTRSGVGGQSFAAVLGGDPRVNAHLYRVLDDNVTRSAVRGGLCGENRTSHLAVSEYVDSSGNWVFKIAAFKGERPLGAPGQDPELCGAYAYIAPQ
jgi:hypothetical protein